MALPKAQYNDPLSYLLWKESKTCKGCIHSQPLTILGVTHQLCTLGKKHGTRCRKYQEDKHE
jgi:hypothetical protein